MQVVSLKVYVFICGQFIPPTKDGWDFLPKSLKVKSVFYDVIQMTNPALRASPVKVLLLRSVGEVTTGKRNLHPEELGNILQADFPPSFGTELLIKPSLHTILRDLPV